ncbi:MAG: 50S ribosomal protein L6 [candidate division WOR-3 bacterium]
MSRLGKKAILIPDKVEVKTMDQKVVVSGPLGKLEFTLPSGIEVKVRDRELMVSRTMDTKAAKACHGLTWSIIKNMIIGTTVGYRKELVIHGVGYKAQKTADGLQIFLGFTKPVAFPLPKGIECEVTPPKDNVSEIVIKGIDKQLVGDIAARLRRLKIPDPYKHRGIRYKNEILRKKIGKRAIAQT